MRPLSPDDPRLVGRYRTLAVLGEGGMGRALLAVGPDGRFAAVKLVFSSLAHDSVFRDRFRREVAASRLVSGAYTASVLDADPESDTPWLASVYVPGPSLAEVVDEVGPLDVTGIRHLAVTLAVALADIHRAGLIHRDLKPGNVLLTHDGPRVIDFGIARAADGADLTATNALIGSPAFMSPEQALGKEITPASDVFSLGSLLLTAATGQRPFAGASTPQTLYNVAHLDPDLSSLPAELREFVEPCLAKDPAQRPTPQQLVDRLGPVTSTTAPWPEAVRALITRQEQRLRAVTQAPPPPPPTVSPGRRRPWMVPVAAYAVALVAVLVVVLVNVLDTGASEESPSLPFAFEPDVGAEESLSIERLRRVDPCIPLAHVRTPSWGALIPDTSPYSLDSCYYRGTKSGSVQLRLATRFNAATPVQSADGRTIHLDTLTGCEASIQLPEHPDYALSVQDAVTDSCEDVQAALEQALDRLRSDDVLADYPADSAYPLDPCQLLDDAVVREVLGPARPTFEGLHVCRWGENKSVRVRVAPGLSGGYETDGVETRQVSLNGVDAEVFFPERQSYCGVRWAHRPVDDRRVEEIDVVYSEMEEPVPCEPAQQLATEIASALPRG
ncbi:serine/threonine-protein kinase [Saccharomonospora sp. NB11]|uniref:serine/threonine-protein kinase n=1 Tax=Saccharomonospora sp. NB11 TaxID=1642298 RepID=UPI0018D0D603|nr:serine/threonine-protein kinase [Saccharomonospora sp. NB11]